jgi:hypothetical protein
MQYLFYPTLKTQIENTSLLRTKELVKQRKNGTIITGTKTIGSIYTSKFNCLENLTTFLQSIRGKTAPV